MAFEASKLQDLSNGVLGANLMFVCLSNQDFEHSQLLHECNFQSGSAHGSH